MDLLKMAKQVKEMRSSMAKIQDELARESFTEEVGPAKVTVNGEMVVQEVQIDLPPGSTLPPGGKVEEAIKNAANKALHKAKDKAAKSLSSIAGGLNIPGLGM